MVVLPCPMNKLLNKSDYRIIYAVNKQPNFSDHFNKYRIQIEKTRVSSFFFLLQRTLAKGKCFNYVKIREHEKPVLHRARPSKLYNLATQETP